ncbi:hypothetical protein AMATHDRAFT_72690 [Amanita thiersii Skay4041]|uniref:Myotubularin phosphatase domain-containing protein n=1 Tax=Amanita thiersii Skay4041 TaxID=703135 RepID=A0A2A9NZV2_9AGAR|nr:hypothetical protein AMATHDRAFT_72690 [Amanita thiersii Skay4041]
MDSIRVSKVEGVACLKSGSTSIGTIHLTAHHLIFRVNDAQEEMWVPYPLISLVNRLPQTLQGRCPLTFHTRTFETFSLVFNKEADASDVFESVKELTVAISVIQLYAFYFNPSPQYPTNNGWSVYSPREEFGRMGIGTRTKAWRFTDINKDYSFCSTYPARLVVPTKISDTTLQYASKYRSKCRIPILTYLHWANFGSITRSSQPMVGITQNRSIQDEKLIEAIFQSHWSPELRTSNTPIYGATTTNLIIDARPTTNAMANTAKGAGTENMDHYRDAKKAYLGIDHIHTMRESLAKVVETLREADSLLSSTSESSTPTGSVIMLDRHALRRSGWLRHISAILEGTLLIVKNVHINSSHVLIHCSDGWDRTAQLSSLSQICLDPYYRTINGFKILVEKDWLSFGHKFLDRCGHLSSEKFFVSPAEYQNSGGADAAQAFLASVQNRFASQSHIKETSPIFHQFLECVRQMQIQFPERFEFNERFLRQLYYHLYSCQFGTFLYNCERDRKVGDGTGPPPCERTISVWDFFNSPSEMEQNLNPSYDPSLDDPSNRTSNTDMGVLLPNPKNVRFWNELYGRMDEEMNGRFVASQAKGVDVSGLVEGFDDDPVQFHPSSPSKTPVPSPERSMSCSPSSPRVGQSTLSVSPRASSLLASDSGIRLSPARKESLLPFSSSSEYGPSLRPSSPAPSPNAPPSPGRGRPNPQDFLSSGGVSSGVKSMWGKLSSNASAAFSVVQEAYVGMAKDIMKSGNDTGTVERTSELQPREPYDTWSEPIGASKDINHAAYPVSTNPWATTRQSDRPSIPGADLYEGNPWSSIKIPKARTELPKSSVDEEWSISSLPLDPTVAHPPTKPISPSVSTLSRSMGNLSVDNNKSLPDSNTRTKEPPSSSSTDPLGVGFL